MQFTYKDYGRLIENIKKHGYQIVGYCGWRKYKHCVILRHDIDNDIGKAVELAAFEQSGGVSSTYFILLTSEFYNVFSKSNIKHMKSILSYGHEIGLHFDEAQYPEIACNTNAMRDKIRWEAKLLGEAVGCKIKVVSMHRPSKAILEADLEIPDMINSYGKDYFNKFKYLSDSRCRWREPVEEIVASERYERLHILTHAFWYHETEQEMDRVVSRFVNAANWDRYLAYEDNFTNLSQVMTPDKVLGRDFNENK